MEAERDLFDCTLGELVRLGHDGDVYFAFTASDRVGTDRPNGLYHPGGRSEILSGPLEREGVGLQASARHGRRRCCGLSERHTFASRKYGIEHLLRSAFGQTIFDRNR